MIPRGVKIKRDIAAKQNYPKRVKYRKKPTPSTPMNDRTELVFPKSRQIFQSVNDKYQVRDLLIEQNKKYQLAVQMHTYCFERGPRSYMYTKCIQCGHKQKMKFIKQNEPGNKFRLIYFDNTHNHNGDARKRAHNYNIAEIFQDMQQTPRGMMIQDFKEQIKVKYGVSDHNFYYILARFRKNNENITQVVNHLREKGCFVWTEIQSIRMEDPVEQVLDDDPPFFMFAFPRMLANYQRYGQCCYLNVIRGLIRKRTIIQNKDWEMITFNGLTFNNRFAPFALAFLQVTPTSRQDIVRIISNLFERAKKTPQTIITPYQTQFEQIIQSLRKRKAFDGLHIFDGIQQLQQIQKLVPDINQFKYFQDIVQSISRSQFYRNVQRLLKNVIPTLQIRKVFNQLMQRAGRMCFALIQTEGYIGMGFKYSANKYMSILVRYLFTYSSTSPKSTLPRAKELYPSIKFLIKEYQKLMIEELSYIRYETQKFEQYMSIPEIQVVRFRLKIVVLDIFLAEFNKVFHIDARERKLKDPKYPNMKIYDIYDKTEQILYVVAARPQYDSEQIFKKFVWRCNCLYSLKCGMPCAHQIKVVLMNNSSILDQIHDRWIQPKIGRKKAPGRPKVSRRNIMH